MKNRKGLVVAAVAIVLALAVTAYAVMSSSSGMDQSGMNGMSGMSSSSETTPSANGTGDGVTDERTFIEMMIPHHQSAIEMARMELARGKNAEAKAIARGIVRAQDREIAQMRSWYRAWYGTDVPKMGMGMGMGAGMSAHMAAIRSSKQPDRAFLAAMIPHHASAIVMADEVLAVGPRAEITRLARTIIADQSREVGQMQQLRQRLFPPLG